MNRREFGISVAASTLCATGCNPPRQNSPVLITKYLHVSMVGWSYFKMIRNENGGIDIWKHPGINPYSKYCIMGLYYSGDTLYDLHSLSPTYINDVGVSIRQVVRITGSKYLEDVVFTTKEDLTKAEPFKKRNEISFLRRCPELNQKKYLGSMFVNIDAIQNAIL